MSTLRSIMGISGRGFRVTNGGGNIVTVKQGVVAQVDVDDQKTRTILAREKDNFVRCTDAGTFTVTIASPGVFTKTGHGFVAGDILVFSTTGALPTGLTAGTKYYVIATGLSANSFQVSATYGGSAVNTTGSQSGTHTVTPQSVNIYGLSQVGFRIKTYATGLYVDVRYGTSPYGTAPGVVQIDMTDGKVARVLKRAYGRYISTTSNSVVTVRGLQEQQNGFDLSAPVSATATVSSDGTAPADGDTIVVNDKTYRFKTTIAQANDVHLLGTSDATLDNLVKAVNLSGVSGTDYFAGTTSPTGVTAAARTGTGATGQVTFTATTPGTAGNAFASTDTSAHLSYAATTFTGGAQLGNMAKVYKATSVTVDPSQAFNFTRLRRHFKSWIEV